MPDDERCIFCGKELHYPSSYHAEYCSLQCWKKVANVTKRHSNVPPKYLTNSCGRRCHDCGKPTPDYRCQDCWKMFREKNDSSSATFPDEAYSSGGKY